ncbi:hypothetical protein HK101_008496 [Irineochytrium annulatum]|nr:hypothetical protein HK101_008496 [Irineochytrium annulatum]
MSVASTEDELQIKLDIGYGYRDAQERWIGEGEDSLQRDPAYPAMAGSSRVPTAASSAKPVATPRPVVAAAPRPTAIHAFEVASTPRPSPDADMIPEHVVPKPQPPQQDHIAMSSSEILHDDTSPRALTVQANAANAATIIGQDAPPHDSTANPSSSTVRPSYLSRASSSNTVADDSVVRDVSAPTPRDYCAFRDNTALGLNANQDPLKWLQNLAEARSAKEEDEDSEEEWKNAGVVGEKREGKMDEGSMVPEVGDGAKGAQQGDVTTEKRDEIKGFETTGGDASGSVVSSTGGDDGIAVLEEMYTPRLWGAGQAEAPSMVASVNRDPSGGKQIEAVADGNNSGVDHITFRIKAKPALVIKRTDAVLQKVKSFIAEHQLAEHSAVVWDTVNQATYEKWSNT